VPDLKDILNEEDDLRNDDLLKYLQDELSKDDQHKVEKQIIDSDFVSDAVEGLQRMQNKRSIDQYVDELNRNLQKHVSAKKHRKEKRKLKDQPWIIVAVIVVIGLCIIGYAVIKYQQKHTANPVTPAIQKKQD
jgi:cytoskeletal protein RodZ